MKPLTELGEKQVRALGKWLSSTLSCQTPIDNHHNKDDIHSDNNHKHQYFWRMYSSDLGRTKATTQLLLQEYHHHSSEASDADVRYDPRLREIARGLRQGLPKVHTYDEATAMYMSGQHPLYHINATTTLPILETDDDGWNRMYTQWFMELLQDIAISHNKCNNTVTPYNVLVVTHAALLRVFLQRLLGTHTLQQHPEVVYKYDNNDTGIPIQNRLHIPNTSCTILRIDVAIPQPPPLPSRLHSTTVPTFEPNDPSQQLPQRVNGATSPILQRVDMERFTSTDHFQSMV